MIGGSLVSSSGSAAAIADTTRTHTSAGDVVKAAAEDLIPGAKLARLGMRALSSRREAQARADSTARLRLARIEIVKVD